MEMFIIIMRTTKTMVILNDEDADDAFAGDDPPVAIPGCSTKASQLQVNDTSIYQS